MAYLGNFALPGLLAYPFPGFWEGGVIPIPATRRSRPSNRLEAAVASKRRFAFRTRRGPRDSHFGLEFFALIAAAFLRFGATVGPLNSLREVRSVSSRRECEKAVCTAPGSTAVNSRREAVASAKSENQCFALLRGSCA